MCITSIMVIHIQFKFHEVLIIGYLVMTHFINFKSIKGQ